MEGGNGVSFSERNYAVRRRRTKSLKRAYQNDEAKNLPRKDSALGVLLDGYAVKPFWLR